MHHSAILYLVFMCCCCLSRLVLPRTGMIYGLRGFRCLQEAYPGWTSGLIWLLVLHSAQREIRERHHYSVDVVAGLYMGILLWRLTGFVWSKRDELKVLKGKLMTENVDAFVKAAKDGDMEKIRQILSDVEKAGQESSGMKVTEWIYAGSVLTGMFALVLVAFVWTENG